MTLWAFLKRRREMNQWLSSNSQVTFSRYFRLMALATMDTVLTVPLGAFSIWLNVVETGGPSPWRGWADAHWGFSRVSQVPALLWRTNHWTVVSFNMTRVFIILCAVVFFAFFGFAEEARKNYRKAFWGIARRFGYTMPLRGTTMGGTSAYVLFLRLSPSSVCLCSLSPSFRNPNIPNMSGVNTTGSRGPRVYITTETKTEKRDSFISSIGDLSSSFSVDARGSLDEKRHNDEKLSPVSTSTSGSSSASGSFIDMTATNASARRSFDSMRDIESAPQTPAEEVELRGLPRLPANAPTRGPGMV